MLSIGLGELIGRAASFIAALPIVIFSMKQSKLFVYPIEAHSSTQQLSK